VCGGDAYGGRHGCGIFFCAAHRHIGGAARAHAPLCTRCYWGRTPYAPTPDTLAWVRWKATDASWQRWRDENPKQAMVLHARIAVEG
ncbi:hypothetical protein SB822_58440, partial [Paraburkholderia sp. SIMBA_054]